MAPEKECRWQYEHHHWVHLNLHYLDKTDTAAYRLLMRRVWPRSLLRFTTECLGPTFVDLTRACLSWSERGTFNPNGHSFLFKNGLVIFPSRTDTVLFQERTSRTAMTQCYSCVEYGRCPPQIGQRTHQEPDPRPGLAHPRAPPWRGRPGIAWDSSTPWTNTTAPCASACGTRSGSTLRPSTRVSTPSSTSSGCFCPTSRSAEVCVTVCLCACVCVCVFVCGVCLCVCVWEREREKEREKEREREREKERERESVSVCGLVCVLSDYLYARHQTIYTRDMPHSHAWRDSFLCVTWLVYSFVGVTCLIRMRDTHLGLWHGPVSIMISVCTAIVVCVKVCVAVCIATCMSCGFIISWFSSWVLHMHESCPLFNQRKQRYEWSQIPHTSNPRLPSAHSAVPSETKRRTHNSTAVRFMLCLIDPKCYCQMWCPSKYHIVMAFEPCQRRIQQPWH